MSKEGLAREAVLKAARLREYLSRGWPAEGPPPPEEKRHARDPEPRPEVKLPSAAEVVARVRRTCTCLRRGTFHAEGGVVCVFCRDSSSSDSNSPQVVARIREALAKAGIAEVGFAFAPEGDTWALLVRSSTRSEVEAVIDPIWSRADDPISALGISGRYNFWES